MSPGDMTPFRLCVTALAATFRAEPTEALLTGWWLGLEDLALADVQRAAATLMRTAKFMPVPRDVRELCGELSPAVQGERSWGKVVDAIQHVGPWQSVHFAGDGGRTDAAIQHLGGWSRVCGATSEELHRHLRRDFLEVYSRLSASAGAEIGHLVGDFERLNQSNGHRVEPPVLVVVGSQEEPKRIGRSRDANPLALFMDNPHGRPQRIHVDRDGPQPWQVAAEDDEAEDAESQEDGADEDDPDAE